MEILLEIFAGLVVSSGLHFRRRSGDGGARKNSVGVSHMKLRVYAAALVAMMLATAAIAQTLTIRQAPVPFLAMTNEAVTQSVAVPGGNSTRPLCARADRVARFLLRRALSLSRRPRRCDICR